MRRSRGLMHLESGDLFDDPTGFNSDDLGVEDLLDDEELGNIFGDIVGAVGKIATAPIDMVAKALPKPVKRAMGKVTGSVFGTGGGTAPRKPAPTVKRSLTSGTGSASQIGLMREMVKMLGAKDVTAMLAGQKPRVAFSSSGSASASADTKGQKQLVDLVTKAVNAKLTPKLTSINNKLGYAATQRAATFEHDTINNQTAFRKKVLGDLMRLSMALPEQHPTRVKIRKVGIMSGLL